MRGFIKFRRATRPLTRVLLLVLAMFTAVFAAAVQPGEPAHAIDEKLRKVLREAGFTGRVQATLEKRLQRKIDPRMANLGRLLFFDVFTGLHDDNACAGCHSPSAGFGDTQSIAIGIQSNLVVGPHRAGPRNQRRAPSMVNTAFYPALMWNSRFSSVSGDPFDNSQGFLFPPPEGRTKFPPNDPLVKHLLVAQAHIPTTELVEMAGFTGTKGQIGPRFDQFDDGKGSVVPPPDESGFRDEPIRQAVLDRLNANAITGACLARYFPKWLAELPSISPCSDVRLPSLSLLRCTPTHLSTGLPEATAGP